MKPPISIQLYTVRRQMVNGNHLPVLKRIAEIGYKGVEGSGGAYGLSAVEFRRVVEDLGMAVSAHSSAFPTPENVDQVIDETLAMGTRFLMAGFWIPDYESVEAIQATAAKINAVQPALQRGGVTLCLHNHWFEFQVVEGRLAIERLLALCPGLHLELDVYWAAAHGENDPAAMLARFCHLAPLIHVKDGPLTQGEPHAAVGSGKLDIPAVMAAADPNVLKWATVELDECATDMLAAVEESYRYLVSSGLCEGNR